MIIKENIFPQIPIQSIVSMDSALQLFEDLVMPYQQISIMPWELDNFYFILGILTEVKLPNSWMTSPFYSKLDH